MQNSSQWKELTAQQLVRYEALFKLHDDIHNLEDIGAIAQRVATQWKYIANVISWRLVISTDNGFKVIDGFCGKAKITDTQTLSPWDEHQLQRKRPCLLKMDAPLEGPQPPDHLTGKAVSEIEVFPFIRKGRCVGLLSVAEGVDPLIEVDKRFIRLFGGHFADCVTSILLRQQAIEALSKQLKEREVLIQEIHHRVKNNMQVISSLFRLQSNYIKNDDMLDMIRNWQIRVDSMALVHEMLYQSKNLSMINLKDYFHSLIANIFAAYKNSSNHIVFNLEMIESFFDPVAAIPLGQIITELVSNSLKHAFTGGNNGEIKVCLKATGADYLLNVTDNGKGFPDNLDYRNTISLGLQLVTTLVDQLRGTIRLDRSRGTAFEIVFPRKVIS